MASTYTPLGIELMATGENAGTWGTKTNANLNLVEQLAGGFKTLSIAGGAQTTALTVADGALTGTAQARMIEFTGTISGNQIVTIPNDVVNFYILKNGTSGSHTVQFKYASGSGDTFTFAAGNKGTALLFASGNPDTTDPKIIEIQTGGDVVDDTSPQLGGNLDTNDFNIAFDDAHGIIDENGNEQLIFQTTSSAVNQFDVTNAATGNAPSISATGGDTNIDVAIIPKGSGETKVGTGAAAATITSSGAHDLTLDTNSGTNSGTITITDGANGDITLTPNGTGDVVASADTVKVGDSGAAAVLTSNGAGTLTVTTGGATDLILSTNSGTDSGVIQITDAANGNIAITPNGTGDVHLSADTVQVGDNNADATVTTNGTGNLTLNTNGGTDSGTITIVDAANGNITVTPNGSGNIVLDGLTFPNADGSADTFLKTNGSGTLSFAAVSGGTSWQAVKTSNFTAVAGEGYFINTTSGVITMTLPSSPTIGDEVAFADYAGTFDSNTMTVGRNSEKINGATADLTVSVERAANTLVYTDGTQGWLLKNK